MNNTPLVWQGIKTIPKHFEEEELQQIFNSIMSSKDYWKKKGYKDWGEFFKYRDVVILASMYLLGLRPKEAACLRIEDLDFKYGWVFISGQNNKTRKDRKIPMPKTYIDIVTKYLDNFSRTRFWRGSDYLFPSFMNNHISPERIKHIFREKGLKPCGLWSAPKKSGSKYTPTRTYALRHTFATKKLNQMIEKNGAVDWEALACLLGHSDIRSTKIYAHKGEAFGNYLKTIMEY